MNLILEPELKIGSGEHPSIAQDTNGLIHIVYKNNSGVGYRTYNPTTGEISGEQQIYQGEVWAPQIAIGPTGEPHIVVENSTASNSVGVITYLRKSGGVWNTIPNLYTDGYRAMMPRIAVDGSNRAHIVFWKNPGSGTTLPRGEYVRIRNNVIEMKKDLPFWDGNRFGNIAISSGAVHIFPGHSDFIGHWVVSESGTFAEQPPLNKPAGTEVEKLMEGTGASAAFGGYYGFSRDAGAGGSNLIKEIFHTRTGSQGTYTKTVSTIANTGSYISSIADLVTPGVCYALYAQSGDFRGKVAALNSSGEMIGPVDFAYQGQQHDGIIRHGPNGTGGIQGGVWIVWQDNRAGSWSVYVRWAGIEADEEIPTGVPTSTDWLPAGEILHAGPAGSWDVRFGGALTPCAVIKKDGTFFLYYIGADGDMVGDPESPTDPGPRHRSVGVATSQDGINFTKYERNPIITHLPNNGQEEGVFSLGACLDESNNVIIYYSSMESLAPLQVDSDVSVAISQNGLDFTLLGDVLLSSDPAVWGYGDELFPTGALRANGEYYVWYIAKGKYAMWDVGLAVGQYNNRLTSTQPLIVYGSGTPNDIVGGGMPVIIGDKIFSFWERGRSPSSMEVFWAPITNPAELHGPVMSYPSQRIHSTIFRDPDTGAWFMYHAAGRYSIEAKTYNYTTPTIPPEPALQGDIFRMFAIVGGTLLLKEIIKK